MLLLLHLSELENSGSGDAIQRCILTLQRRSEDIGLIVGPEFMEKGVTAAIRTEFEECSHAVAAAERGDRIQERHQNFGPKVVG